MQMMREPSPGAGDILSPFEEARRYLEIDTTQASYAVEEKMTRMSAKLFNCTPAQLPVDLREVPSSKLYGF